MSRMEFAWTSGVDGIAVPVYFGRAYQSLLADHDQTETRVLACTANGQTSHLPVLVRDLGNGQKEAYSAYGYGGLLGRHRLTDGDIKEMRHFLSDESVIAIFIRHSPFLANQQYWPQGLSELNRHTYAVTLQVSDNFDVYLKDIPQKLRWSVNYARRAGLQVTFSPLSKCMPDRIQAFYRLYAGLMQQKQTSGYYLFSEEFFHEHARSLGKHCELAEIVDPENGNLLAGAFFLLDESGWSHYHLSAATQSAMKLQGMELLIAAGLQRYGNMGYRALHLGGGHALDESDGLSRFKSKFSSERLDFCCTKLVCNEISYQRERARLPLKNPNLFLISDARRQ